LIKVHKKEIYLYNKGIGLSQMVYVMFRKISIIIFLVSLLSLNSCKKKNQVVDDNIPYQTVNITIYPNNPLYNTASGHAGLSQIGGWAYIDGGVNGIIVYRLTQNSTQDFVAIERTSSHLPDNAGAVVKVQSDNFTLKDTVSGSKWQITDGAILSGPTTKNLRLYNTYYDSSTDKLSIRNN
jgi:hypothetical protein